MDIIQPDALGTPPMPDSMSGNTAFNLIIPKPFSLKDQDKNDLDDIRDEVIEKERTWDKRMSTSFEAWNIISDNWRIKPKSSKDSSGKTLFDSKSGETHRAVETLATLWHRMLFAADPYLEAVAQGLNPMGLPITESELYSTEGVLLEQHRVSRFKAKVLRWLRSLASFGLSIAEEPYVSLPYGYGRKYIEYTDFNLRSLILTGYDTSVVDVVDSDFIFTIDFISKWMLRNQSSQDTDHWDQKLVEKHISEYSSGMPNASGQAYSRWKQVRSRAGYYDQDAKVYENLNYHGRLETNSVIEAYAESEGLQEDPKFCDWSVGVLDGTDIAKFHMTQYGDWRTRFKSCTYKDFENEVNGYGVGQLGRKLQRNMDVFESMTDDGFLKNLLGMLKVGKMSGYDQKQWVFEPNKAVELDDINQLDRLVLSDPQVLSQALALINLRREDFRNVVGAQTNLQAQITKASATESAIAQTEAIRAAGVHAEIIAETFRSHYSDSHVNNLNFLDEPIWTGLTGDRKPILVDKTRLPINVGFLVKIVTDKDFRPERQKNLLQLLQMVTSIRNFIPSSVNAIRPIFEEIFRNAGMNPRVLNQPMPVADLVEKKMNQMASQGGLPNEVSGEVADEHSGAVNMQSTPMGDIPTSNVPQADMSA